MIVLDDRKGSGELLRFFRPFDVMVAASRLEYGDACWPGNGPTGDCLIGLERKRITDLVQSMRDRRLSGHQLPGLVETYEFVYLVVEGYFRPGDHGELEERRGKNDWRSLGVMYREVDNHLSTLELKCGVIVRRTSTPQETVTLIVNLYKWWNDKTWDKHRSHRQVYAPTPEALVTSRKVRFVSPETMIRRKYGDSAVLVWKMAAQIPGLDAKAEKAAAYFRTVRRMANARVEDWIKAGFGKVLAGKCVEALR